MRIVLLGSPVEVVPIVEALFRGQQTKNADMPVLAGIVSQPAKASGRGRTLVDTPVAAKAKELGIPLLTPESARDSVFLEELRAWAPDICVTAAYGQILSNDFLAVPRRATINIHPSLLPKYRGAVPVPAALVNGDLETGVTILFTVRKLDAGSIISQRKVPILTHETAGPLLQRLFVIGGEMLPAAFAKLKDLNYTGEVQDENAVTHCSKIDKDDGNIDWNQKSESIINKFRAFEPWPGSFTFCETRRLVITGIELEAVPPLGMDLPVTGIPGRAKYDSRRRKLFVEAGDKNFIAVSRIKPAGSKDMDAAGFWNGLKEREHVVFKPIEAAQ